MVAALLAGFEEGVPEGGIDVERQRGVGAQSVEFHEIFRGMGGKFWRRNNQIGAGLQRNIGGVDPVSRVGNFRR